MSPAENSARRCCRSRSTILGSRARRSSRRIPAKRCRRPGCTPCRSVIKGAILATSRASEIFEELDSSEDRPSHRGIQNARLGGFWQRPAVRAIARAPARQRRHNESLPGGRACAHRPAGAIRRGHRDATRQGTSNALHPVLPGRNRDRLDIEACGCMRPARGARFRIRIAPWMLAGIESIWRGTEKTSYILAGYKLSEGFLRPV